MLNNWMRTIIKAVANNDGDVETGGEKCGAAGAYIDTPRSRHRVVPAASPVCREPSTWLSRANSTLIPTTMAPRKMMMACPYAAAAMAVNMAIDSLDIAASSLFLCRGGAGWVRRLSGAEE